MALRFFKLYEPLSLDDLEKLLQQARAEIKKLDSGDCFAVQDLFIGYVWRKLSPSDRKTFGRLFSFYAEKGGKEYLDNVGKSGQSHQIYRKK
ncbi:MAG: single-stranded DNA-binding protein [Oscillospiraceae bacterium]|nr:single-stranded DNA-binding protein [Oscillospiraceae bacterium]